MGQPVWDRSLKTAPSALWGVAAVFLAAAFIAFLRDPMRWATMELDLNWMMPAMRFLVEGKSAWEFVQFVLSPTPPALEPPVVKAFLFLTTPVVGLSIRHLVGIALLVQMGSALLLYRVLRQMGLGLREGLVAAGFFLTTWTHFHAYLWPTAFQHLFAVFTILLLLHLYLRGAYVATLAAGVLASVQRSGLIGLALILADILFCSKDAGDRTARYRRWLPLFIVSSVYPVWTLTLGVDGILTDLILHSGLPQRIQDIFLPAGATLAPISLGVWKAPLIFLIEGIGLAGLGWLLRRSRALVWAGVFMALVIFLFLLQDKRQLLLPYNAVVPFATALFCFLDPIRIALQMGTWEASHYGIPPQISLMSLGTAPFFLAVFGFVFCSGNRRLLLFLVWYSICLLFLFRHQYAAMPLVLPSRYFIFLTPCTAVVFGSVTVYLGSRFPWRSRGNSLAKEGLLLALFVAFCLTNLAAVRLASWRGRLPNSYVAYDDIRTAFLIEEEIRLEAQGGTLRALSVHGVEPMTAMHGIGGSPYRYLDPARQDHFRIAVLEAMGRHRIGPLFVNDPAAPAEARRYRVQSASLLDSEGRRVDRFGRLLQEGFSNVEGSRVKLAMERWTEAEREKPFLLNYCLPRRLRMEDVRWLTGGQEFRAWLRRISNEWRAPTRKFEAIRSTMEQELSEYVLCLFSLSALEAREGRIERSKYWLSRIGWLEQDPVALQAWLNAQAQVREHPFLREHLSRLFDPEVFSNPLPWRRDDFGFGRFLLRFLLGWDLRSSWDNRLDLL